MLKISIKLTSQLTSAWPHVTVGELLAGSVTRHGELVSWRHGVADPRAHRHAVSTRHGTHAGLRPATPLTWSREWYVFKNMDNGVFSPLITGLKL